MNAGETLLTRLPEKASHRLLLEKLITTRAQLFNPMLQSLAQEEVPLYLEEVADIVSLVTRRYREDADAIHARLLRGLDFHNTNFLRRQLLFLESRQYQATDLSAVFEEVYLNDELMQEYLDGLLLTYVAWPNHYRILRFYKDEFLRTGETGQCLEIGPGHGYFAFLQLLAFPTAHTLAFDVSPCSLEYSSRVVASRPDAIDPGRFRVLCEDFLAADLSGVEKSHRVTMAEVLEHVADPLSLVARAADHAAPDAVFFITTVINLEAVDHVYLFTSAEEIRDLLEAGGLRVEKELILPLPTPAPDDLLCANYAAICSPIR